MAGLKEDNKPFISAFDLIGAPVMTDDFVVGGTCTNNLYGMCESLYRPNMVSEQQRCLHSAPCCMTHTSIEKQNENHGSCEILFCRILSLQAWCDTLIVSISHSPLLLYLLQVDGDA